MNWALLGWGLLIVILAGVTGFWFGMSKIGKSLLYPKFWRAYLAMLTPELRREIDASFHIAWEEVEPSNPIPPCNR